MTHTLQSFSFAPALKFASSLVLAMIIVAGYLSSPVAAEEGDPVIIGLDQMSSPLPWDGKCGWILKQPWPNPPGFIEKNLGRAILPDVIISYRNEPDTSITCRGKCDNCPMCGSERTCIFGAGVHPNPWYYCECEE